MPLSLISSYAFMKSESAVCFMYREYSVCISSLRSSRVDRENHLPGHNPPGRWIALGVFTWQKKNCRWAQIFLKRVLQSRLQLWTIQTQKRDSAHQGRRNDFERGWASPGKRRWSVVISKTKTTESNAKSGWARPTQFKKWVGHWPTWPTRFRRHCCTHCKHDSSEQLSGKFDGLSIKHSEACQYKQCSLSI